MGQCHWSSISWKQHSSICRIAINNSWAGKGGAGEGQEGRDGRNRKKKAVNASQMRNSGKLFLQVGSKSHFPA